MAEAERLGTRVVRAARALPPGAGDPVVPPLVQSVAFDYGAASESALAEIEGTASAVCFVSGMAATHAYVTGCGLQGGGRIVAQEDPYGSTRALLERLVREQS